MELNKEHTTSIAKLALLFLALAIFALWLAYDASAVIGGNVYLHLPFDSNANDTENNITLSVVHEATFNTSVKKIGAGSIYFAGNQYVNWTHTGSMTPANFTIVAWVKTTQNSGNTFATIFQQSTDFTLSARNGKPAIYDWTGPGVIEGNRTLNNGSWRCYAMVIKDGVSSGSEFFLDGEGAGVFTYNKNTPSNFLFSGTTSVSENEDYIGNLDELTVHNKALSKSEIQEICAQTVAYPYGVSSTDVNINLNDYFNSSSIDSFSSLIAWPNGSTTAHSTTNGTITLINISSGLINITFYNITDYFNTTLYNETIVANTTTTITGQAFQAIARLQAYAYITNSSLSGVTFYINGTSGTEFNLTAGTHEVIAEKAGYYNLTANITVSALTNDTYNIEGLYNSLANVSAYNQLTSTAINSFSFTTSFGVNYSTTSGSVEVPLLNNTAYSLNLTATNFTSVTNYNFTINNSYQNVSVPTWVLNSIRINIFNESSGLILNTTTVTVHAISNLTSTTNTTTTGFIQLGLLTPNDYELRFEADTFNPRSVFLSVTNDSTQNISVYLTENATTEIQVIEVLDTSNSPIEGAVVWLQKQKLNTSDQWITIQEAQTDYNGKTSVWVERDTTIFYRFAVIHEGIARPIQPSGNLFTGPTSFIPGVTETIQLIVNLESEPTDFLSDDLAISYNITWVNNNSINFTWLDGRNSITGAILQIEASYINESLAYVGIVNLTSSSTFGYLNYTIPYINNSIWRITAYISFTDSDVPVWSGVKRFDINVIIEKNTGLIYAIFILLVVALLTVTLGPLAGSLITIGSLVPLTYLKFISIPTTLITSLLALAIIFFLRTRKLDE